MGLFKTLFGVIDYANEEEKRKEEEASKIRNEQIEKDAQLYGLDDNEKNLVKNGDYESTSFEEEDNEEDDYYSEDN
jgi:hypothetical protein